jgi:hypothetical protein
MRKGLLFLVVSFIIAGNIFSQITITSDDFPSVGDTYVNASDESPANADPGSPGPNQSWNFTGFMEDFTSSSNFVTPGSTPFSSLFPDANLATNTGDTIFSFIKLNTDKAASLGIVIESVFSGNLVNNYVPEELIADFPLNYQDEWIDEYYYEFFTDPGIPGVDSTRFKSEITSEVEVDAWGTVTIPLGTFNALRLSEVRTSVDSSWAKVAGIWMLQFTTTTMSYNYEWWTNEAPVGPFLASMSSTDNFTTIDDATWVKDAFVNVPEANDENTLGIYPNPASDYLYISTGKTTNQSLMVINSAGQVVIKRELYGAKKHQIDIAELPQGMYHCIVVEDESGTVVSGSLMVR